MLRGAKVTLSTTAGAATVWADTNVNLGTIEVAVADDDVYAKIRLQGDGWRR
jgi:hypothetical protein